VTMQKDYLLGGVRSTIDQLHTVVSTDVVNVHQDFGVRLSEIEKKLQHHQFQSMKIRKGGKHFPQVQYDLNELATGICERKGRVESMLAKVMGLEQTR
jgi:hypothetical protein